MPLCISHHVTLWQSYIEMNSYIASRRVPTTYVYCEPENVFLLSKTKIIDIDFFKIKISIHYRDQYCRSFIYSHHYHWCYLYDYLIGINNRQHCCFFLHLFYSDCRKCEPVSCLWYHFIIAK